MKHKRKEVDQTLLSAQDTASFASLVDDLRKEGQIPVEGTWSYVVKLMTDKYIGSYIYYDGPMIQKSSGSEPSYRKIIYVGGEDWSDEHIFNGIADLFNYLRLKCPLVRRYPFTRNGSKQFIAQDISTLDLRP